VLGRLIQLLRRAGGPTARAAADKSFVAFVTTVPEPRFLAPGERPYSALASLRVLIPAAELARRVPVALIPLEAFLADPTLASLGAARAIVLGKIPTDAVVRRERELRAMLELLRTRPLAVPVFADLSDDYAAMAVTLGQPFLADYQRGLAACCALTVPCQALAERLAAGCRGAIHVLEDPWESPHGNPPRAPRSAPLEMCWFGNIAPATLPPVEAALRRIAERLRGTAATLAFVAGANRRELAEALGERLRALHPAFGFRFVQWSREATWHALEQCDLVLLPQDHASEWGRVKSHNRLVEAIRAGRLALASPIPSYLELAEFAWIGEDLAEGVAWALAHPDEAARRVARGQAAIETRFSPEAVGAKWAALLGVAARPVSAGATRP
jgi:glycosyltransferase involved in cell wall biosynthesis